MKVVNVIIAVIYKKMTIGESVMIIKISIQVFYIIDEESLL